ncbi:hypothetical protein CDAR_437291 [Caerostris darwini]|uniref:RNase H type-1 domain-containing protein n=1 Tax=Caerostris darwini TaxID=1538125 RepID=A0AAV4QR27_9ARAC|nr:hypothetical protein CDAR_437291 [Caerostris darwini]
MYTDGSKNEKGGTGSGIHIISNSIYMKIQRSNTDSCTVISSELIAINESLDYIATVTAGKEIWILQSLEKIYEHRSLFEIIPNLYSVVGVPNR